MAANENELASEILTVTTENILKKTRSVYDPISEQITSEVSNGLCSCCGKTLDEKNVVRCCFGDLVCGNCVIRYKGHSLCRNHVEVNVGTKNEAFVLLCICLRLDRNKTKKATGLSDANLDEAVQSLAERGHITKRTLGLIGNQVKPTEDGQDVIGVLIATYQSDYDFKVFLKRISIFSK